MLLEYRDGMLDPRTMETVRARLAADTALRDAYQMLVAQETALRYLGDALREVAPVIDMRDAVMERLHDVEASNDPLEKALFGLGTVLRSDAPRADIVDAVAKAIPSRSAVKRELTETGNEIRAHAPRVDVTEEVRETVASGKLDSVVPFPAQKRSKIALRRGSQVSWRFVVAAAACVLAVVSLIVMQMAQPSALRRTEIASQYRAAITEQQLQRAHETPPLQEGEPLRFTPASSDERISLLSSTLRPAAAPEPDADSQQEEEPRPAFNLQDIIAAKRNALNGQSASLALLARWGALDPDEIRRLLDEGLISSTELAGLSRFLPDEDARALLLQAIEQNPDDPLLRYALARHLMDDPKDYDEALGLLNMFRGGAPDNSLPYYMEAQIRLAQGDYAGALQALEYAAAFQSASAYALENAQHHSAALQAAGLPYEVAQLLAAFNAGTDEYGSVTQLAHDLLGYGAYFESIGDYETALAIYKGVQQLGLQVGQGATFTNELLAGLDTQTAALEALNALAQMMDIPGGLYTIEIAYTVFVEGLDFFLNYTNAFENMMGGSDTENMLRAITQIMRMGEISFFRSP